VLDAIVSQPPPMLPANESWPDGLHVLLSALLQKEPADRPGSHLGLCPHVLRSLPPMARGSLR
jgi:hypothetical protein